MSVSIESAILLFKHTAYFSDIGHFYPRKQKEGIISTILILINTRRTPFVGVVGLKFLENPLILWDSSCEEYTVLKIYVYR